ncbi:MAG: MerR family transcriptional regulator [Pleurocapsa sp. MO_226.B13]|nr:MerR family transcriptional regulator [Pleurocapsa sp. MO_226.B13]
MLKISDFAQLSRISPKTLRLYDRLGLLKPAQIDRQNSYRYYHPNQLPRLNRILVFKELGFSLEQIGCLLDENISVSEIRGMLRLKQLEIQQRLSEDAVRLNRVKIRLQELEQEKTMSNYEVILKPVSSQLVASTLGIIPNFDDCGPIIDKLFDRVYSYVFSQGIEDVGSGINVYHETKLRDRHIPIETLVPIPHDFPAKEGKTDSIWVYELPEVETMACVVHHGSFDSLGKAYDVLLKWVCKHEYQIAGSTREIYLEYERNGDPNQYVTEVQIPVEKVA